MKIKTADWLGVEFSDRKSSLRLKVFNTMHDAIDQERRTGLTRSGHVATDVLSKARSQFCYDVNTDGRDWRHFLFTEKAGKLADAIPVDDNFNYGLLAPLAHTKACYMPRAGEFFRWYNDAHGILVMHMVDTGGNNVHRVCFQINFPGTDPDSTFVRVAGLPPEDQKHWLLAQRLLRLIVFTELTPVELLVVESGGKSSNTKAPEGQRVTNQTAVPITRVHAHWNTFYINTSIIDVRGFVRQQPYGKGRLLRREVLIQPHTRNGYQRKEKH